MTNRRDKPEKPAHLSRPAGVAVPPANTELAGWNRVLGAITNLKNELTAVISRQDKEFQAYQTGTDGRFRRVDEQIDNFHTRIDNVMKEFNELEKENEELRQQVHFLKNTVPMR